MHREIRVSNYVLVALSALALVLLSLPLATPVRELKAGVVYLLNPVAYYGAKGSQRLADVPPGLARLLRADLDNIQLQARLREALWQKSELEALRMENRRLSQALGLRPPRGYIPLWADVMERDPLHWYSSIMISVGAQQGVTLNAPVFGDQDGTLVALGRVTEVRRDSALVLLVTDEASSVAAYLSTSAVEGLVQGQGGPRLRMNYLPSEVSLSTGDLVYTSPTSATFPGEILLGRVMAINPRDPFLTFQSVEVRPAADAAALSRVMVLRPAGAAGPAAAPSGEAPALPVSAGAVDGL
jgi:rod shape-determining protein MreC